MKLWLSFREVFSKSIGLHRPTIASLYVGLSVFLSLLSFSIRVRCFSLKLLKTKVACKSFFQKPDNQRSNDIAPLPFITIINNIDSSIIKYSIPSPFFFPFQFIVHPAGA